MEAPSKKNLPPHHTLQVLPYTPLNRLFALLYMFAIIALFYHQTTTLLSSNSISTFFLHLTMFSANVVLAFMWFTTQSFRMNPVKRHTYPENLKEFYTDASEYPNLDVFICTADPYKEPPMNVVNTALSVMAYDYPSNKISVYVSDDGGSELTLFAFMEAAKFAKHWLPFCRENNIVDRSPEVYFRSSSYSWCPELDQIKMMYENMKVKVEIVVERGHVGDDGDRISMNDLERETFKKWTDGFTRQSHPTVIQVLLDSEKDRDVGGQGMPNLVYVAREKSRTSPHRFKAGALNTLLRVSATMTNAPMVLTLDCDTFSSDPKALLQVLCYLSEPLLAPELAYLQFPQRYHGINKNDTYGAELKRLYICNSVGTDGLAGPYYVGTGCFFRRRAFFGGPSAFLSPEIPELHPENAVDKSINSTQVLETANHVASCDYETGTKWGSKIGFRYGSLVEDYFTGYRMQCEGWKSVFCNPDQAAFLGDAPINLDDALNQNKRWAVGLLEVTFSKYNPLTFGTKNMGFLMGLAYAHNAFRPFWFIPITAYALIPQLALINRVVLFPKVSDSWFYLYVFLFLGSYIQDFVDFILFRGTVRRWWSDQRMWLMRGLTSFLFASIDFILQSFGISSLGFSLTSKVVDDKQSKRYEQGMFEFGVASPNFVPLVVTAMLNLTAFAVGISRVVLTSDGCIGDMFVQLFMSGFGMVNCWPVYEAIAFRSDKGKMPVRITIVSVVLAWALHLLASLVF